MQQYVAENINSYYYSKLAEAAGRLKDRYKKRLIHDFRVDIKKLRAFYLLLSLENENTGGKPFTLPRKLKKMYDGLGRLRDLQQQKASVESFAQKKGSEPTWLLHQLKHQLKKQSSRTSFLLPQKYFPAHAQKTNDRLPYHLSAETLHRFLVQKMDGIRAIVGKGIFDDDELHAIRKNIKDMLYVSDIYTEHIKSALPLLFWQAGEQKKMEALAKDLGEHNDRRNSLAWLQRTTAGYQGGDKKKVLAYYQSEMREKKALRDKIVPELKSMALSGSGK